MRVLKAIVNRRNDQHREYNHKAAQRYLCYLDKKVANEVIGAGIAFILGVGCGLLSTLLVGVIV